jgi:hypothetical protein
MLGGMVFWLYTATSDALSGDRPRFMFESRDVRLLAWLDHGEEIAEAAALIVATTARDTMIACPEG